MLHHADTTHRQFIGLFLESIERCGDSLDSVRVTFTNGQFTILSVYGDCCSTSWFYEIVFPDEIKGGRVLSIAEGQPGETEDEAIAKMRALTDDFSTEEQSVWDIHIDTDKGTAIIRHINVSNGYYDGCTSWSELSR